MSEEAILMELETSLKYRIVVYDGMYNGIYISF